MEKKRISPFKSMARLLYENGSITYEEYVVMRSDSRFSRAIVVSAVIMTTLYLLFICQFAFLNIQNHTSVFPPTEFTAGYFAFWTVEIVMLASLKRSNVKNKHEKDDDKSSIIRRVMARASGEDAATAGPLPETPAKDPEQAPADLAAHAGSQQAG